MKINGVNNNQNIYDISMSDPNTIEENRSEDIIKEIDEDTRSKIDYYVGLERQILEISQQRSKIEEIARRISKGQAVNDEDIAYIRNKNPQMLEQAREAKNLKLRVEMDIRAAKTREEAVEIINTAKKSALQFNVSENETNLFVGQLYLESIEEAKKNSNIEAKRERKRKMGINELV